MNESRRSNWVENGLVLLVILAGLLGPQAVRAPNRYQPSMLTTLAPWAGIAVTLAAFVLHATWNAAKVDSAIATQNAGLSAQATRTDQVIAGMSAEQQRIRELESTVLFLCNERRRDNEEAGRTASGAPC